jgi:V/A-type H+-transporting ATPase subunit A
MSLNVLLLADSTSRWAQAMREMSGRLEEIPGEEAFPAYLESTIASFYERAGIVRLKDGSLGSVTIGGTVSPAGGNFEEPVTQATLKVVGAFHGLSRERSDARKFPAIHPLDSWSKYRGIIPAEKVGYAHNFMRRGIEVEQMMKVVGEEGTSIEDYVIYLKGELIDSVYFQQNSFDAVDAAVKPERQEYTFNKLLFILGSRFTFGDKNEARSWFNRLRQKFLDYNGSEWKGPRFAELEKDIEEMVKSQSQGLEKAAEKILA